MIRKTPATGAGIVTIHCAQQKDSVVGFAEPIDDGIEQLVCTPAGAHQRLLFCNDIVLAIANTAPFGSVARDSIGIDIVARANRIIEAIVDIEHLLSVKPGHGRGLASGGAKIGVSEHCLAGAHIMVGMGAEVGAAFGHGCCSLASRSITCR